MLATNADASKSLKERKPLEQSILILEKIDGGMQMQGLRQLCDDDDSLLRGHVLFLKDIGWLLDRDGGYEVTDKGKAEIEIRSKRRKIPPPDLKQELSH